MGTATSMIFEEVIEEAKRTFIERNRAYNDGWVVHGEIMASLFPDGITLNSPEDFSRFLLLEMCLSKLNRYAQNFESGGHKDSIHDLGIYSFILETYDEILKGE